MKINTKTLDILGKCKVEENILYLPDEKLDRNEYTAVNKVLENLGGKWNKKVKGHVFDHCPADDIDSAILTGEITDKKKEYQFFPTPAELAEHLCDLAEIDGTTSVLEPSCGKGNIADAVWRRNPAKLLGIELNTDMGRYLAEKPYETRVGVDFMQYTGETWDRIVMNPPFTRQQDIDHVLKAHENLAPGGILVAIVSESPFFRTNKKSEDFREFLSEHGAAIEELPEGAFKESGTMVKTRIIKIHKA